MLRGRRGWALALLPLLLFVAPQTINFYGTTQKDFVIKDDTGVVFTRPGGTSLLSSLIAYYRLDEQSGTRVKTAGSATGADLSATNAPGTAGGAGAYAANLIAASNQSFTVVDNASLSLGAGASFSLFVWARPTSVASNQYLLTKATTTTTATAEYIMRLNSAVLRCGNGNGGGENYFETTGTVTANARTLLSCRLDNGANTLTAGINTSYETGASKTIDTYDNAADFQIGTLASSTALDYGGVVGPVLFYKRVVVDADVTALYNNGLGYSCAALPAGLRTGLVACWDLSEASGTRAASTQAGASCTTDCDLSAVNAPGRTAGLVANGMGLSLYIPAAGQYLFSGATSLYNAANTDMTVTGWGLPTSVATAQQTVVSMWTPNSPNDWWLGMALAVPTCTVFELDGTSVSGTAGSVTANAWTWFELSYDQSTRKVTCYANATAGTPSAALPNGIRQGNTTFRVGRVGPFSPREWTGAIEALGYWQRKLTTSERTALYAAGVGVEYPWSSIVRLFDRPAIWADRPLEDKQRAIYARTGVYVPGWAFPSARVR